MAYSRPSSYPYPRGINNVKDVVAYQESLYKALQENDRAGEYAKDKDTDTDLKELIVRPEWYGAKGDGVHDDVTAINAAITATNSAGGGIVLFSEGTYLVNDPVVLKSNVILRGCGRSSAIHRSTEYSWGIYANGISNFGIESLRVYGDGYADTDCIALIYITNASYNGYVRRCFLDTGYLGIVVGQVDATQSYSIDIIENTIHNLGLNGVSINSYGSDFKIEHNLIYNVGINASAAVVAAGAELRGATRVSFSHNIIRDGNYGGGPYNDGVRIEYGTEGATGVPDQISCIGNIIDTVSGHGFRVGFVTNSAISGNLIKNTGGHGILLLSSSSQEKRTEHNIISGNSIYNVASYTGISLEGDGTYTVRYNSISGNVIKSCQTGMSIFKGDENVISGNIIELSTGGGISQYSGVGNKYIGNKTANCGAHGFALGAGDRTFISGHDSHNNVTQGFSIALEVTNTFVMGLSSYDNGINFANPGAIVRGVNTTSNGLTGIGTLTPSFYVHIYNPSGTASLALQGNQENALIFQLYDGIPGVSNSGFAIRDETNGVNRITIDSNGAVGMPGNLSVGNVRVSPPTTGAAYLDLIGTQDNAVSYQILDGIIGVSNTGFSIRDSTNGVNRIIIDSAGDVGISGNLKVGANQVVGAQAAAQADLKADYATPDLDTEAEVIAAINATNAGFNALLAKLRVHGTIAT